LSYNLKKQNINYANINFVNLIEFDIVTKKNENPPFSQYMQNEFYSKLKIHDDHIFKINQSNNETINKFLNKNTIDVLILEVGVDGHVCFNNKKYQINFNAVNKIKLSESTREEYACLFDNNKTKVPLYGLSVNLKNILNSKKIIIIANGNTKATTAAKLLENKIDKTCLTTYLIKNKNVYFYADLLALQLINK
jgi:glucosamine-6-phosphate deaminase